MITVKFQPLSTMDFLNYDVMMVYTGDDLSVQVELQLHVTMCNLKYYTLCCASVMSFDGTTDRKEEAPWCRVAVDEKPSDVFGWKNPRLKRTRRTGTYRLIDTEKRSTAQLPVSTVLTKMVHVLP